ncbi:MAG: S41 family peptidase [Endomicrobium sp.]|jgi:carboxyl-terminal processing protease|nr:S41 family peptidase [Endomicrobium sp.]
MEKSVHLKKKVMFTVFLLVFYVINLHAVKDNEIRDELKSVISIMRIINKEYVSEVSSKDLITGAIRGIVNTLDPFSQYIGKKAYKELKNETKGIYSGVGLRITVKDDFITVMSPLTGTPAYKAGIFPEDKIIKIDNKSTTGMSIDKAAKLMRGVTGKKVKLVILRKNFSDMIEFNLVREKIKIETVKTIMLDKNIAYVRLTEFNAQSADDIKKELFNCKKQGMQALILDLRNNPGGLLDSTIKIISLFIKDRTVAVTIKGRSEESKQEFFTDGSGEFYDIPLVILVNRGSASAAEILSGVMQDFKRALIIGNNTFGKGSVQSIIPLPDGTALRLTIAKYYLPSGRSIDSDNRNKKNCIIPDIKVEVDTEEEIKFATNEDAIFLYGKKNTKNIQDKVLNKAISIIKENKIIRMD